MAAPGSPAQAKAQLSALLDAVESGEDVEITRRGVPVALHKGIDLDTSLVAAALVHETALAHQVRRRVITPKEFQEA